MYQVRTIGVWSTSSRTRAPVLSSRNSVCAEVRLMPSWLITACFAISLPLTGTRSRGVIRCMARKLSSIARVPEPGSRCTMLSCRSSIGAMPRSAASGCSGHAMITCGLLAKGSRVSGSPLAAAPSGANSGPRPISARSTSPSRTRRVSSARVETSMCTAMPGARRRNSASSGGRMCVPVARMPRCSVPSSRLRRASISLASATSLEWTSFAAASALSPAAVSLSRRPIRSKAGTPRVFSSC